MKKYKPILTFVAGLFLVSIVAVLLIHAQTIQHGTYLTWQPATGTSPSSYNIYRSTIKGGETNPTYATTSGITACTLGQYTLTPPCYIDAQIVAGTTYYYTITQTVGGVESSPSIEVTGQLVLGNAPSNPQAAVH